MAVRTPCAPEPDDGMPPDSPNSPAPQDHYPVVARLIGRYGWVRDQSTYGGYEIWRRLNRPPLSVRMTIASLQTAISVLQKAGVATADFPAGWLAGRAP